MREQIAGFLLGVRPDRPNSPKFTIGPKTRDFLIGLGILAAVITLFFLSVSALRGWGLFGPSKDDLRWQAELAEAEARFQVQLNARDAEIADIARDAALNRQRLSMLSEQGRNEIDAATPLEEAPIDAGLERAWRASIVRLYADTGANAPSPDPGGPGA